MDSGKFKAREEEEEEEEEEHRDLLKLSLKTSWLQPTSCPSSSCPSNPNFHYPYPLQNLALPATIFSPSSHSSPGPDPSRRPDLSSLQPPVIPQNPNYAPGRGPKIQTVPEPFPWATDRRAMLKPLRCLKENQILTITGTVQCKTCDKSYEIGFDLESKFAEVSTFIAMNKDNMYDRAPKVWLSPRLPICKNCRNSVRPVISEHKKSINWLFLFLGQLLGCCTLDQLKYYCKHTGCFRTGAKDRILYITYLGLCEQLVPSSTVAFDK